MGGPSWQAPQNASCILQHPIVRCPDLLTGRKLPLSALRLVSCFETIANTVRHTIHWSIQLSTHHCSSPSAISFIFKKAKRVKGAIKDFKFNFKYLSVLFDIYGLSCSKVKYCLWKMFKLTLFALFGWKPQSVQLLNLQWSNYRSNYPHLLFSCLWIPWCNSQGTGEVNGGKSVICLPPSD